MLLATFLMCSSLRVSASARLGLWASGLACARQPWEGSHTRKTQCFKNLIFFKMQESLCRLSPRPLFSTHLNSFSTVGQLTGSTRRVSREMEAFLIALTQASPIQQQNKHSITWSFIIWYNTTSLHWGRGFPVMNIFPP